MILFEVHPIGIPRIELKRDAPWSINVDAVASRTKPPQRMKIKATKIHLLRPDRNIQTIEADQNSGVEVQVPLATSSYRPKVGEALVPERLDHERV
jgi:hypothetical protein